MKPKDLPLFRMEEVRSVLDKACRQHGVKIQLLRQLLDIQRTYVGSGRARGITTDFDNCLGEHLEEQEDR